MEINKIKELVSQMTLEEKASLTSGADFWHTESIERLGIKKSMVSDGPHGLRKQEVKGDHLGLNDSIEAVCFPAGCALAASFNKDLVTKMGEALGNECQAEGVSVILGPAVNIKRSPLCGRNFEYYSEDPLVASEIASAMIKGVQSKNVGTSIKHFLANNQEHRRMSSSSEVDERTLREIYLAAFEGAVVKEKPWTVMCSYNKINGVYAAENKKYLTDVLRNEWGFDGYVVSDWGAVNNRVKDLEAGLDLEMPGTGGVSDKLIVEAVKNGSLDEEILNKACERILNIVYRFEENRDNNAVFDRDLDHELARKVAEETIVLMKNDSILPLDKNDKIAFIGKFAAKPRYQGGGSSHINSHKVVSAMDEVKGMENITYAQGYIDEKDEIVEELINEAVEAAKKSKIAVVFAGLPDNFESEGYDRTHMKMPNCQNALIDAVCKVQPNTVVVLHNGSPVEMPWKDKVKGIVEAYLGGQAIGSAVVDVLFGKVNPSGKLPETFPLKLEDNPSYLYYFGEGDKVEYREGVFVGYRYYETKKVDVLFPFGHGLSYTNFKYSNITISDDNIKDTDTVTVTVDVTNTGDVLGKEVVQLYVSPKNNKIIRPVKELKGFEKIALEPGETKTVSFILNKRSFAYWNMEIHDWHVESGKYDILIGKSVSDIVLSREISVTSTVRIPKTYTLDSIFGDLMEDEKAMAVLNPLLGQFGNSLKVNEEGGAISPQMLESMIKNMPIRALLGFVPNIELEYIYNILDKINN